MKTHVLPVLASGVLLTQAAVRADAAPVCEVSMPSAAPHFPSRLAADADICHVKGTTSFLDNLHLYRAESSVAGDPAIRQASAPSTDAAACAWIESQLQTTLSPQDRHLIDTAAAQAKLIRKTSIQGMRWMLEHMASLEDGIGQRGICASLMPQEPFVSSYNRRDRNYYGVILNPDRMSVVLASTNDLDSDCSYVDAKWDESELAGKDAQPCWNGKPVVNAAPSKELCSDVGTSIAMIVKDAVLNEGMHDHVQAGKILRHNEIVLLQKAGSEHPMFKGLFVDLISNALFMRMSKASMRPWLQVGKPLTWERWMYAMQAVNIQKLLARPEEFLDARALCAEQKLPFHMRILNQQGEIEFKEVDVDAATSLADFTEVRQAIAAHHDPMADLLVKAITYWI